MRLLLLPRRLLPLLRLLLGGRGVLHDVPGGAAAEGVASPMWSPPVKDRRQDVAASQGSKPSSTGAKPSGNSNGSGAAASSGANKLSISLSAIVASLWAGIWGFDWAATHLGSGALFVAVLIGLAIGASITFYLTRETFRLVRQFEGWQHEAQMRALAIEDYRARHGEPSPGPAPPNPGAGSSLEVDVTAAAPPEVVLGAAATGTRGGSPPAKDWTGRN